MGDRSQYRDGLMQPMRFTDWIQAPGQFGRFNRRSALIIRRWCPNVVHQPSGRPPAAIQSCSSVADAQQRTSDRHFDRRYDRLSPIDPSIGSPVRIGLDFPQAPGMRHIVLPCSQTANELSRIHASLLRRHVGSIRDGFAPRKIRKPGHPFVKTVRRKHDDIMWHYFLIQKRT